MAACKDKRRVDNHSNLKSVNAPFKIDAPGTGSPITEAGSNASALVLKDKDLDALSDDPDELESELSALAGPSAGPNGGQIYIDGFSGGQLACGQAIHGYQSRLVGCLRRERKGQRDGQQKEGKQ